VAALLFQGHRCIRLVVSYRDSLSPYDGDSVAAWSSQSLSGVLATLRPYRQLASAMFLVQSSQEVKCMLAVAPSVWQYLFRSL
jgi:hypothetical protein